MIRKQWLLPLTAAAGVLAAATVGMTGCGGGSDSSGLPGSAKVSRSQVVRGRYLVTSIAACMDCHGGANPNDPNWLAGFKPGAPGVGNGQSFQIGPFTTYASNLTPDKDTGLGNWTSQEIFNALRNGKDKEGNFLCPPMPWTAFRNMTDSDLWSIVAYLQNIKAVSNAVPESGGPGAAPGAHGDWSSAYTGLQSLPVYPGANETASP